MKNDRKRSYKQIENDSDLIKAKNNHLLKAKQELEQSIEDLNLELKWYKDKDNAEIDHKRKLEQLQSDGYLDDNFNPKME